LIDSRQVTYWREEPREVDAVFDGSWGKWAVEVKTGKFDVQAPRGLLEFCRRHPAMKPLVICAPGRDETARRHGIQSVGWEDFLIASPQGN
jgi:predicted RecB family endonuclease